MNKKVIVVIVVLLLILALGGAYWYTTRQQGSSPALSAAPASSSAPQVTTAPQLKSLRDLLSLSSAQKCTYSTGDATNSATGTIYVNAGKIRGDINTTAADQVIATHVLVIDNTAYVWLDDQTTGFKMSINPAAKPTGGQSQNSLDPDKLINYDCSGWTADASLFTLPANVKFSNFGTVSVPSVSVTGPAGSSDKCAPCAYLSGQAQTQCLTALGCNQ